MKFTTDLPADYANSSAPFVLFCPPDPDAISVDWRMKDGTWQRVEGPDQTRREGMITTIRGRNLGAYARLNQEEGKAYGWLPMPAFIEQLAAGAKEPVQAGNAGLPVHIALLEDKINQLNTQISSARRMAVAAQDAADATWKELMQYPQIEITP